MEASAAGVDRLAKCVVGHYQPRPPGHLSPVHYFEVVDAPGVPVVVPFFFTCRCFGLDFCLFATAVEFSAASAVVSCLAKSLLPASRIVRVVGSVLVD
jgi:hypothetical protein